MKTIEATLLTHLGQPVTTTCLLVKVECVGAFAGQIYQFTNLDIDVDYDDGDGLLTYRADNGFSPRRTSQSSGIAVDNSEIDGIVSDTGITEAMVRAGLFKSAKMTIYRVNYEDLTSGRHEVVAYGRAGQTVYNELGFNVEFRSLSQLLKQPIAQPYSLTCRAIFGSKPIGTGGEQPEERKPCGMDWEWNAGTVSSVGAENDRIFSDSSRTEDTGYFSEHGGVLEWLTGNNAGNQMEVDVYTSDSGGGTIELVLAMPYPIVVTDTYRIRRDCDKLFATCRDVYANTLNNRSENLIPVDGTAMVPGAEIVKAR